jgi:hypothetical protein
VPELISEDFLLGGGEMGALTRVYDWTKTPLGAPIGWPQSLKTAVRLLLTSQHPMFIWWGPELIQFFNDAYRQTMGRNAIPVRSGSAAAIVGRKFGKSSARRSNWLCQVKGRLGMKINSSR